MSPTGSERTIVGLEHGFTLLELLVVLVIAACIAAAAPALLSRGLPGFTLRAAALDLAKDLRAARGGAMTTGHDTTLSFDLPHHSYAASIDGRRHDVAREIALTVASPVTAAVSADPSIRFFSDGSSSGGRIALALGSRRYTVVVDWLTGRTSIDG